MGPASMVGLSNAIVVAPCHKKIPPVYFKEPKRRRSQALLAFLLSLVLSMYLAITLGIVGSTSKCQTTTTAAHITVGEYDGSIQA